MSYSDFPVIGRGDPEVMSVCVIGTRSGGAGPAGGRPTRPVCKHGTALVKQPGHRGHLFAGKPYFTVAPGRRKGCENEGAYPAVNLRTGSVYVGYEFNGRPNFGFEFLVESAAMSLHGLCGACARLALESLAEVAAVRYPPVLAWPVSADLSHGQAAVLSGFLGCCALWWMAGVIHGARQFLSGWRARW